MAVPTYDELLKHYDIRSSIMKESFDDKLLRQFSLTLDVWETLAKFLEISNLDITNIKSQADAVVQTLKMLECWKQRRGPMATYEAMVKALLQIGRTDLAVKVMTLRCSSKDTPTLETATTNLSISCPKESSLTAPPSPANSIGIEDTSSVAMSPLSLPATPNEYTAQVISTLRELEEEFYDLVIYIEDTLETSEVSLNTITRRFRMLPQSVRRQHQTDENYTAIRQKILDSDTIKKLFDNLTELKHWNYMTPDTLAHILKDIRIDDIHKKIEKYNGKLLAFKANTKLRELIGISFPVPDYCIELTMEVEGWEDETIQEVENKAVNIVRRAAYSGSPHVSLGWKRVMPGSIKVTFILMESVKLTPEKLSTERGLITAEIDGSIFYSKEAAEIPSSLWYSANMVVYNVGGGRDVLILAPDLSLPHPEAVARRPGQLTEEDKLKLQSQGLPPDCQSELDIIRARYDLDKRHKIVQVKSGQSMSQNEAKESIMCILNTTQNDGVVLYYIGAGRRSTGDWCFEDGFITFRDIAQLYLRASHNFKGRVLTIISDSSYSGCWVRDCMEFLDDHRVQPCGHKAREKGIIIKVFTSCKPNEIPTEYWYSVSGIFNDKDTGGICSWRSKQLLETQTVDCIDSSHLHCSSKTIDEPCTLPPCLTWREQRENPSSAPIKQPVSRSLTGITGKIVQTLT